MLKVKPSWLWFRQWRKLKLKFPASRSHRWMSIDESNCWWSCGLFWQTQFDARCGKWNQLDSGSPMKEIGVEAPQFPKSWVDVTWWIHHTHTAFSIITTWCLDPMSILNTPRQMKIPRNLHNKICSWWRTPCHWVWRGFPGWRANLQEPVAENDLLLTRFYPTKGCVLRNQAVKVMNGVVIVKRLLTVEATCKRNLSGLECIMKSEFH